MPATQEWLLYSKADLVESTPSRADGITYEEELALRQKACKFAYDMHDELGSKDRVHSRLDVTLLLIHHFYTSHSFMKFDYCTVAAVCLYLSVRDFHEYLIRYVVHRLVVMRDDEEEINSGAHYSGNLEWFRRIRYDVIECVGDVDDIKYPITCMFEYQSLIGKELVIDVADRIELGVLCITDWSIRYSNATIVAACIRIASFFRDIPINENSASNSSPWYHAVDNSIRKETLDDMLNEFIELFRNSSTRFGKLETLDIKEKVKATIPAVTPKSAAIEQLEKSYEFNRNYREYANCSPPYDSYVKKIRCERQKRLDETRKNGSDNDQVKVENCQNSDLNTHSQDFSVSRYNKKNRSGSGSAESPIYLDDEPTNKISKTLNSESRWSESDRTFPKKSDYYREHRSGSGSTKSLIHPDEPTNKISKTLNSNSKWSESDGTFPKKSDHYREHRSRSRSSSSSDDDEPTGRGYSRRSAYDSYSSRKSTQRESGYKDKSKYSHYKRRH